MARPACSTASRSSSTASAIPDHVPLWTLQGRTFTLDELRASTDVRWQLDEPATITVPKPGGLSVGVHRIEATLYLRRSVLPAARSPGRSSPSPARASSCRRCREGGLKYCVSTYSYTGDVYTSMTLEDVFADIADLGATGIEILGEGNLPELPDAGRGLGRRAGTGWSRSTASRRRTSARGSTPRGSTAAT